ncbi:MAG: methyltransferase [archaeon]
MSHYFSEKQDSKLKTCKITLSIKGISFTLFSGSGVFSKNALDLGSRILIENAIIKDNANVLDLGCGYGAVGISVKKLYPSSSVTMADVNERALALAKKNIELNCLESISAIKSNVFESLTDVKFDVILLNPPQSAGKDLCIKMILESKEHLNSNGTLQIVARHNKGGESLSYIMEETFGNVKTIAKQGGFRIYLSENLKVL